MTIIGHRANMAAIVTIIGHSAKDRRVLSVFNPIGLNIAISQKQQTLTWHSCAFCVNIRIHSMFVLNDSVHYYNTRSRLLHHMKHNIHSASTGSIIYLASSSWNNLPSQVKNSEFLVSFKKIYIFVYYIAQYTE